VSVNFTQKVLVGVSLSLLEIERVISEAVYENQPNYDTKTGKKIGENKVLVKEAESVYDFGKFRCEDLEDLVSEIEEGYGLTAFFDNDFLYVGEEIGESEDYDRVDLRSGEIDLEELMDIFARVGKQIDNPKLIFMSIVG
jgi:hypothetical protein